MTPFRILAHRGASYYAPENTMEAFSEAIAMGADGFELDVQFSKDGKLVVIHDDSIDRTSTGKGKVAELTLSELRQYDYNVAREELYPKADIPTLDQVLELVKKNGLYLNIELKDIFQRAPRNNDLGIAALKMVKSFDLVESVILSSFQHYSMAELKASFPEAQTGLLYMACLYEPQVYAASTGADAIHPLFMGVRADMVAEAHKAGIAVNVWTVDDAESMKAMKGMGVDSIITDRPDLCRDVRDANA